MIAEVLVDSLGIALDLIKLSILSLYTVARPVEDKEGLDRAVI